MPVGAERVATTAFRTWLVMIVEDGEPLLDVMRRERLSTSDLSTAAREKGSQQLDEIQLAVLEADGKIGCTARIALQTDHEV